MRVVAAMVAVSVGSWALLAAFADAGVRTAALAGMLGPLAVAGASWVAAERAWRRSPESLTPLMITAFAGKMLFFAAYVVLMLRGLSLAAVPFIASFVSYFIGLYLIEALSLKRLFAR